MRIGVLEWDISAMGGRHRTMMAFADYLVGRGHDVTFLSDFSEDVESRHWTQKTFLEWFPFRNLTYDHFEWSVKERNLTPPASWNEFDVLLCSYGHWGYLAGFLPSVRVITWVILPTQKRNGNHEVWTNSSTSVKRLRASQWATTDIRIVHPPHDYSPWRIAAAPARERDIDVCVVGSMLYAKGMVPAVMAATAKGLSVAVIGTTWRAAAEENVAVWLELNRIRSKDTTFALNVPYHEVAKIMGRSKVYLSMSQAESCSLAVYEAMNAGCQIVARDVGAVREQIGDRGLTFSDDVEVPGVLDRALADPILGVQNRGLFFDRINCGHETDEALSER